MTKSNAIQPLNTARLIGCISALFLLSACAPRTEPTLSKPDNTLLPADSSTSTSTTRTTWQTFFQDPQLQQLITRALDNNRDLHIALAKTAETRALYGISLADRLPSIELNVSANRSSTPADVSSARRRMNLATGNLQLTLPSYELDLWGRIAHLNQAALAQFIASEANAQAIRLSVIGEIANTYYLWQEANERLRLLTETRSNRADFLSLIEKRLSAGIAIDTDRLQAQAIVEGIQRDIAETERQRSIAQHALSLLTGVPQARLPTLTAQHLTSPQPLLTDLPSSLLLNRPDVRAVEQGLIAAEANVQAARAAFFPRIALTGSYGTASSALDNLFTSNNDQWSFVPQLTLPLFNAGRTQANLDIAGARQVSAVALYEKTVQTAFREVADAFSNRASYRQQVHHQQQILEQQQQRLSLSEKRYTQGVANYLEVLDAQRECQQAEQLVVQLLRSQYLAEVQVFKAFGNIE